MIKNFFSKIYERAVNLNYKNIFALLENNSKANMLDLGCDDGRLTLRIAEEIKTKNIFGVEIVEAKVRLAEKSGIKIKKNDLNAKLDFDDSYFDVVHANQVIEHLSNSDNFLSEIYRVLRPGGYAIISTENASSGCNIFASIMGWQIFSLTNFSNKKQGIGNPLAIHRDCQFDWDTWNHVRIYNIRGLKEYCEAFGFVIEKTKGSGYFPFPASWGNVDKAHSHFITLKIRKPTI